MNQLNPRVLHELAMEYELSDPIDWGMLAVDEDMVYAHFSQQVAEILNNSDDPLLVASAAMTKLLVENLVLNMQLYGDDCTLFT